jgi:PhnB protein
MQVQPYLFFNGRCEEALEYYRRTLGAEIQVITRYKESPDPEGIPPGAGEKVMHAAFKLGDTQVLASDGNNTGKPKFEGISLTIDPATVKDADRMFAALADGGQVHQPMIPTFFAERFGIVADRFGLSWMVMVAKAQA